MAEISVSSSLVALFVLSALNPFGGAFLAIPLAIFKLDWSPWLVGALTIPLIYVQVAVVDVFWDRLLAWPRARAFLEKHKSVRIEHLLHRRDAWFWLAVFGVWAGCWVVMAMARFGGHRQSKVALPLLFGITYMVAIVILICLYAPQFLPKV